MRRTQKSHIRKRMSARTSCTVILAGISGVLLGMRVSSALIQGLHEDGGSLKMCSSLSLSAEGAPFAIAIDPSSHVGGFVTIDPSKGTPLRNRERRLIGAGSPMSFRFIASGTQFTFIRFIKPEDSATEFRQRRASSSE